MSLGRRVSRLERTARPPAAPDALRRDPDALRRDIEALREKNPELADLWVRLEAAIAAAEARGEGGIGLSPEAREILGQISAEQMRIEHGNVMGIECEDCGRAGKSGDPCHHCGGFVGWYAFWFKNKTTPRQREAEIAAARSLGYPHQADELRARTQAWESPEAPGGGA